MTDQTPKPAIPPYANESARYFGVTNECTDEEHPYGTHRHGHPQFGPRYVRWAPEETQKTSVDLTWVPDPVTGR